MARLLIRCLESKGNTLSIASSLRAFFRDPDSESEKNRLVEQADLEIQRLTILWEKQGAPQFWFCYHPYFKSPDLIGPALCKRFSIPYVTAEASYSARRNRGVWAPLQQQVLDSLNQAAVNICFTERDRAGLRNASSVAVLEKLSPFIDTSDFNRRTASGNSDGSSMNPPSGNLQQLVTVAMMRAGDKMDSYRRLAAALKRLLELPWTLSVVGDGPLRAEVESLFCEIPPERVQWQGLLQPVDIAMQLASSALFVWPGCGEAYGLAYLEAQAAGVPVVAYDTAGVPEVVDNNNTGLLTPEGNDELYAAAIAHLLCNPQQRARMSDNAVARVQQYHSLEPASANLHDILKRHAVI